MHIDWKPIYGYFYFSDSAVAHWIEVVSIGLQSWCIVGYVQMVYCFNLLKVRKGGFKSLPGQV